MRYDEFIAQVRERGEYENSVEAERMSHDVLKILAGRITPSEAEGLADQLPAPLDGPLRTGWSQHPETFGVEEFVRRVAEATSGRARTARRDASAVLTTVAESVSGGELNKLVSQLPSDFAVLMGKPELSH